MWENRVKLSFLGKTAMIIGQNGRDEAYLSKNEKDVAWCRGHFSVGQADFRLK